MCLFGVGRNSTRLFLSNWGGERRLNGVIVDDDVFVAGQLFRQLHSNKRPADLSVPGTVKFH